MKTKTHRIFRKRSPQSGQAAALMLSWFALVVLLGAGAFGTDLASYYWNAFQLQNAADAAVLSGAKFLPCNSSQATTTAQNIAKADGATSSEVSGQPTYSGSTACAPSNGFNTITMTLTRSVPFYFGRVVGVNHGTVSVSATAQVQGVNGVNNPTPIGLQYSAGYTLGETPFALAGYGSPWGNSPGNWGPVTYNGTTVTVGETISSRPGNGNCQGCEQQLAQQLINDYNNGISNYPSDYVNSSGASISPGNPRLVVVPLVNWSTCTGNCSLTVLGFANLWITGVSGSTVNVTFVSYVDSGEITGGSSGSDIGAIGVKLIA